VIAVVDGEITVKRLHYLSGEVVLIAENNLYSPIVIYEHSDLHIWGVATYVIHSFKKNSKMFLPR